MCTGELTIDGLERWVHFGAHWLLVEASSDRAVVDLCACTGELVERVECGDVAVIEYLRLCAAISADRQLARLDRG